MSNHPETWLDAYLDGELPEGRRQQIEKHLAKCEQCQEQLAKRKTLSALLQQAPIPHGALTPDQFSARVGQHFHRPLRPQLFARKMPVTAWAFTAVPLLLLVVWIFVQTISLTSNLIGMIPGIELYLQSEIRSPIASQPLASLSGLLGLNLQSLSWLSPLGWLDWGLLTQGVIFTIVALMYLGWLAAWFARQQQLLPAHDAADQITLLGE